MGLPIVMQFSFAHYAAIPESLKHLLEQKGSTDEQKEVSRGGSLQARQETFKDRDRRKQVSNGRCIVQPRLRVAIRPFLQRLKTAGYVLCNARIEQRIKLDERGCTQYWMIRFSFSDVFTGELVNTSLYWRALYELADALWRVRVFRNPQKDGDGEFYSINMEVREPL